MSKIKLQAEREMLEGLIRKHYRIVTSLFRCRLRKEESKRKIEDYEHRISIIDWKLNKLDGKELNRPKPARLGYMWLV